ncbi:trifunctional hydroxymethylpyrimidine kinase/phosphomethylpyrimidine kinase/thiaminase [Tilletia horrida]|uniref:Trifunctional hydroxymethylpyrimidine kinase/phosphomethylpyrimidine kinase/thiaminase n=1 Tax=Tilletia horrida TaxID=155126 RepID=A0AAN6GST2_9BASI|nr:trifunctional hydroxymethylpyrimidine kinase/phosphomethylpyrimidine kinase/thiaminase [Tilletia horrida]KAK0566554.1 trifunctional hydroxymethylpyrimidine kinase/phosphomethylpyrimidine kinase/thiaminase [Tilletia horrida]
MADSGQHAKAATLARVCTIAGSDSGGGAGIQGDLKTIHSLGAYGLSVITALTAQNTKGVQAIHTPPPEFVRQQWESVSTDIRIDAVKIGMLASAAIVHEVGALLKTHRAQNSDVPIVLDPVMVSTSGSMLLPDEAVSAVLTEVVPHCTVFTPNVPEAVAILKHIDPNGEVPTSSRSESVKGISATVAERLAQTIQQAKVLCSNSGAKACLLKGGHAPFYLGELNTALLQLLQQDQQNVSLAQGDDDLSVMTGVYATTVQAWEPSVGTNSLRPAGIVGQLPSHDIVRLDGNPLSLALERLARSDGGNQHLPTEDPQVVVDILYQDVPAPPPNGTERQHKHAKPWTLFVSNHSSSNSTHGTGCTLSSALATFLAQGYSLRAATGLAITYVSQAIPRGVHDLGGGPGALDHGLSTDLRAHLRRAIPPIPPFGSHLSPSPHDRTPLHRALLAHDLPLWTRYTRHPFLKRLLVATDSNDPYFWENFTYFLKQDYLFLQHYARMFAVMGASVASSNNPDAQVEMESFAQTARVCMTECQKHLELCEQNGISREVVTRQTQESAAVVAYTRFVLDIGHSNSGSGLLAMLIAMAPCAIGYAEVGLWLAAQRRRIRTRSGEPVSYAEAHPAESGGRAQMSESLRHRIAYDAWIDTYSGDEFQDSVAESIRLIEKKAQQDPPTVSRLAELQRIWTAAVRLEIGMWDEAVDPSFRRPIVSPF